jgi:hypothetical protein
MAEVIPGADGLNNSQRSQEQAAKNNAVLSL